MTVAVGLWYPGRLYCSAVPPHVQLLDSRCRGGGGRCKYDCVCLSPLMVVASYLGLHLLSLLSMVVSILIASLR